MYIYEWIEFYPNEYYISISMTVKNIWMFVSNMNCLNKIVINNNIIKIIF